MDSFRLVTPALGRKNGVSDSPMGCAQDFGLAQVTGILVCTSREKINYVITRGLICICLDLKEKAR